MLMAPRRFWTGGHLSPLSGQRMRCAPYGHPEPRAYFRRRSARELIRGSQGGQATIRDELIESGSVALYRKSSAHGAARHPADGQNGGLLPPFGGLSYCAICRRHARAQNCAPPHDGRAAESLCGSWVCAGRTLHRELCRSTASDGRFRVVLLGDPSALWLGHEAYGCAVASPPSVNSCRSNCAEACGITSERRV